MFVEKREMDVLTVPDCARFLQGHPIYAENTHAEFSKSPSEWFFFPLFCLPSTVPVKYTRITSKSPMERFLMPKRYPETVPKLCPR